MTTTRTRLMTTGERDYQDGIDAGECDAAKCNDWSDVRWYQRVTMDSLWTTRPRYVAGYVDGFAR